MVTVTATSAFPAASGVPESTPVASSTFSHFGPQDTRRQSISAQGNLQVLEHRFRFKRALSNNPIKGQRNPDVHPLFLQGDGQGPGNIGQSPCLGKGDDLGGEKEDLQLFCHF